jgi:integrase
MQLDLFMAPKAVHTSAAAPRVRGAAEPQACGTAGLQVRRPAGLQRSSCAHVHEGAELAVPDALDLSTDRYLAEAHTARTRRAYQRDWDAFARWCAQHHECALPAAPRTLARYLTRLAELGRCASTIRRARIAIGLAHAHADQPRPDQHPSIRALERGIGRVHGTREEGARPLLEDEVRKLARTLRDSPREDRDRALILLGWAGAFRAGDLMGLRIEDVTFSAESVRIGLRRSKEDPLQRGDFVDVRVGSAPEVCPVDALRRWMGRVGRPSGPLFRQVRGGIIEHARISERCVSRALQRAAAHAGLQAHYSAHSLRAGLATSAYAHGASERDIQEQGRWKDRRSLSRYIRSEYLPAQHNRAQGLL